MVKRLPSKRRVLQGDGLFNGAMGAVEMVGPFDADNRSDRPAYQNAIAPITDNKRVRPNSFRVDFAIANIKQAQLLALW